jgi:hypothetical protein
MKKTKNKKNNGANKRTLLGGAAKSLKKLGKARLSTTQKVVGGAALVALGLSYLSKRKGKAAATEPTSSPVDENLAAMDGAA